VTVYLAISLNSLWRPSAAAGASDASSSGAAFGRMTLVTNTAKGFYETLPDRRYAGSGLYSPFGERDIHGSGAGRAHHAACECCR
jgi:hypothetical protein